MKLARPCARTRRAARCVTLRCHAVADDGSRADSASTRWLPSTQAIAPDDPARARRLDRPGVKPARHDRDGDTRGAKLADRRDIRGVDGLVAAAAASRRGPAPTAGTPWRRIVPPHFAVACDRGVEVLGWARECGYRCRSVARIAAAGRAAWPSVAGRRAHRRRLAERVRDDPETQLDKLHDADLYLAMALAEGDTAALKRVRDRPRAADGHRAAPAAARRRHGRRGEAGAPLRAARRRRRQEDLRLRRSRRARGVAARQRDAQGAQGRSARPIARRRSTRSCSITGPTRRPVPQSKHLRSQYTAELKKAIREAFARARGTPAQPAAPAHPRRADDRRPRAALSRASRDVCALARRCARRSRQAHAQEARSRRSACRARTTSTACCGSSTATSSSRSRGS